MSTVHIYTCTLFLMHFFPIYRYSVRRNLSIDSVDQAISELKLFKSAGGNTLVDVTSIGIRHV